MDTSIADYVRLKVCKIVSQHNGHGIVQDMSSRVNHRWSKSVWLLFLSLSLDFITDTTKDTNNVPSSTSLHVPLP